jgi:hypothetical protein
LQLDIGFVDHLPLEEVFEIVEATVANPAIVVNRRVSLAEKVGAALDHELGPAKLAVIVIPVRVLGVATVGTVNERGALEVGLLIRYSGI